MARSGFPLYLVKPAVRENRYEHARSAGAQERAPRSCAPALLTQEGAMSSTQALLTKIAALRQRLVQVEDLAKDANPRDPLQILERRVAVGAREISVLDGSIRQLPGAVLAADDRAGLPVRLTARGARLLQRGRDLLKRLRRLVDDPLLQ